MSEFTTRKASSPYNGTGPGWNREVIHDFTVVELPTTALQATDITWLTYVPAGAIVVDAYIKADQLDSGTSLAYNIGETVTNLLFDVVTTVGRATNSALGLASTSTARYTKFASATRLKMTVTTTAQTAVAGTFMLGLSYFVDPEVNVTTGVSLVTITA